MHNVTALGGSGVCCPTPTGAENPCGGKGIGTCQRLFIQLEALPMYLLVDDRMQWPSRFFSYACSCEGNYFGIACDECWFGWKGPLCNQRDEVVRRNVLSFNQKEREMFVNIVAKTAEVPTKYLILFEGDKIHSDPLWSPKFLDVDLKYFLVFLHKYPSRNTLFQSPEECHQHPRIDNNHNVVGFATWHRYFVLFWERELRKIASAMYGWDDFAVPYWDWVDATECEVCVNSLVGAPGPYAHGLRLLHPESPFSSWIEHCSMPAGSSKCYGCHDVWPNFKPLHRDYRYNSFPGTHEIQFTLSRKSFYLPQRTEDVGKCRGFHQALEGFCGSPEANGDHMYMHNRVHNMVSGSFCCAATAANDPLFLLHHSQVDRIMQVWFEHYRPRVTEYPNHGVEPGSCRECNIIGFIPTIRNVQMFVDMRDLGIHYDNYKFGKLGYDGKMFIKLGPSYFVTK